MEGREIRVKKESKDSILIIVLDPRYAARSVTIEHEDGYDTIRYPDYLAMALDNVDETGFVIVPAIADETGEWPIKVYEVFK